MSDNFDSKEQNTNSNKKDSDVVISTRVRLARNLENTPFPQRLDKAGKASVIEKIRAVFNPDKFSFIDFSKLSEIERLSYVESHLSSPDFAQAADGMLIEAKNADSASGVKLSVMVNEEDHMRIQAIVPGFDIASAYEAAGKADDMISEKLTIAFDEKLGYLTACPTNLGCAFRISAMLHLPSLTMSGKINSLIDAIDKTGCLIRGIYGEGSEAWGMLYQISNRSSAGRSESEIITWFENIARRIIESERRERTSLIKHTQAATEDRIYRALGTAKFARRISSAELSDIYSCIRMGREIGLDNMCSYAEADKLITNLMPAHLALADREAERPSVRDSIRADKLRDVLNQS
ncbi:Protein-arginine kinase [bioreactor metagenome]|uniref:Protein-arginine kinase n=1 Tax=bioreactor metagenome TaxID=1076179 RepID=A0A644YX97_9ZZZZ|nr:ATP--guanido phosphotransferase [Oscillospiraceae bacterium]